MSAYENVQKGGLKLKGVSDGGIKKKKKSKDMKRVMGQMAPVTTGSDNSQDAEPTTSRHYPSVDSEPVDRRTPSEIAFANAKERRAIEEILKKPMKTHKERIMEFNEHLDNLSEHYDIPKVSWTK